MWLANSSPSSVVFDTAEACYLGKQNFFSFSEHSVAFCTPKSGKGKVLASANDAVNPGNPTGN